MLRIFLFAVLVLLSGFHNLNAGSGAVVPVYTPPTTVAPKAPVYVQPQPQYQPPPPQPQPQYTQSAVSIQASMGVGASVGYGPPTPAACVLPACGGSAFSSLQNMCAGQVVFVPGRPQQGCYPPNGGSFPMPQQPQIIEEIVYVTPQQVAQATGSQCGCMGAVGCPCSGTGVRPLIIMNTTPPPVWMTDSYQPRWNSFNMYGQTQMIQHNPYVFRLRNPQQFPMPRNPRDFGEIQRAHGADLNSPQEQIVQEQMI